MFLALVPHVPEEQAWIFSGRIADVMALPPPITLGQILYQPGLPDGCFLLVPKVRTEVKLTWQII